MIKDPFNPPSLILKIRALAIPLPARWLSCAVALHIVPSKYDIMSDAAI